MSAAISKTWEWNPDLSLQGQGVTLLPLQREHETELIAAASDGELWNLKFTGVPNATTAAQYIDWAIEQRDQGLQQPFVVLRRGDSRIVGSTRFYDMAAEHQNLAIGYTWYSASAQRTAVNTETKLLLLTHAFDVMNCIGVAFHTDHLNVKSQAAIQRLGAVKEGVLRNHRIMPDGRIRHTWCYSITQSEWPDVKSNLSARLLV